MASPSGEASLPGTLEECDVAINGALGELMSSYENITKISEYCKTAYQQEDRNEIYSRTKNYTSDAILNVAYHVYKLGIHFSQAILLQNAHLDHIGLAINSLSDRLRLSHESTGQTGLKNPANVRGYDKLPKVQKLEAGSHELPPCTQPVAAWVRRPIDFDSYVLPNSSSSSSAAPAYAAPSPSSSSHDHAPPPPPPR